MSTWVHPGSWDVIVVGGGHAGSEAALAAARSGCTTLLLTQSVDRIGWMSCNPAIGGVGKSHLVAEIDALGGEMARNTDRAGVHYKWLNRSRGPAVHALRAQCDKLVYATQMRNVIERQPGLTVKQGTVSRLWLDESGTVVGVVTGHDVAFCGTTVVLTAGTFLAAVCHTGQAQEEGGRAGEGAANDLGAQLRAAGVRTKRHKTGTCPRLDRRTVDWAQLRIDPGEAARMSPHGDGPALPQMDCHAAATNLRTHELILSAIDRSPLFSGQIEGSGPRYCPSIEDKVVRYTTRPSHALFLEREGWQTQEVYLSGLSTSLPPDVQVQMVRSIAGLEQAELVRFGYAVEYDTIDPTQLDSSLALPQLPQLLLAGQVNGTSGYEEAAAQGLVAGLSAVGMVRGIAPPIWSRSESYIGVMVDDLVTRGGDEPYRMFTSRAEHRLRLRTGNADLRLTPTGRSLGLVGDAQMQHFETRRSDLERGRVALQNAQLTPTAKTVAVIEATGTGTLRGPIRAADLLKRPKLQWQDVSEILPSEVLSLQTGVMDELVTELRYAGYVEREQVRVARAQRAESVTLAADFDYRAIGGLSTEAIEKLERVRPSNLGQAGRIPGLTAGAMDALAIHIEVRRRRAAGAK
ncbi:MAG: tRNA uridine-5-carboxymethylaminomethyl(34) synthesis enzyme MnmG [Myxococcales bacterium]|nr:tRNA uridine-5-carboxymethylaminomethyl(34) synthesis enzyme MnmG [Myxococcales bacterium]